eukprot:2405657-Heterocapsa_arctica.AAC.1
MEWDPAKGEEAVTKSPDDREQVSKPEAWWKPKGWSEEEALRAACIAIGLTAAAAATAARG